MKLRDLCKSPEQWESQLKDLDDHFLITDILFPKGILTHCHELEGEIRAIEWDLSELKDIYSWKNYEPSDTEEKKKVIDELVDSLYIDEEVLKIRQLIKGPPQKTKTKAPDATKPVGSKEYIPSPEKLTSKDLKELPKKLPRWITLYDLMNRWNKKDFELLGYVKSSGLTAYYNTHDPISKNNPYPLNEYSIFNLSEIEQFEKKYPEVFPEKAERPQVEGGKPDKLDKLITKDIDLKEADKERKIIYDAMIKDCRSNKVSFINRESSDLKQVAIETFTDPEYDFTYMKEKYFKNLNFFTETRNNTRPNRYFREHLLAQVIRDNTDKKDIKITEIRKLLGKLKK